MRKLISLLLAILLMVPGMAALADNAVPVAKSVNVGLPVDIPSLAPFVTTSMGGLYVWPLFYQSLFARVEFGGDIFPMIGKEMEIAEDEMSCVVKLYDYVKDAQGNAIDADDVVFSYEKAIESGAIQAANYVENVEKIDQYTVKINMNKTKLNAVIDALSEIWIVDSSAYDADKFNTAPIGTGPYAVKNYVSGSSLDLVLNDNYWQTAELNHPVNARNVAEINYKIILESAQMAIALETGAIDIAADVTFDDMSYFQSDDSVPLPGYSVNYVNTNLFNNMSFNMSGESIVSDNLALRQAILYALDNENIVRGVLNGAGSVLYTWGSNVYGDYNPAWESAYYDYNVEKAKEMLAEAGYQPGEVTVRIILENVETRKRAAEMIQAYLLQIGVKSEINAYDAALFSTYKYTFDQWDIILDNQANSAALAAIWGNFFNWTHTKWNDVEVTYNGMHNEELQGLVEAAISIGGHTEENMDAVHNYLKDNAIGYGLWAGKKYQAAQDGVTSIFLNSKLYMMPNACTFADGYQSKAA